jgi:electron transfer flavoprotein beta subunit
MKIFVAIKSVPDTGANIRVAPGGSAIDPAGIKFVVSPYDEMALEQALRFREAGTADEVTAVSLGPDSAQTALRSALAMGADQAIHLLVDAPTGLELDAHQTSFLLAQGLRERSFDLLLCGRLAVDDQSSQVGPQLARRLGFPCVAEVTSVELAGDRLRFHRAHHGRVEVVECGFPVIATAQKGLAEARYPSMKSILQAKKKTIEKIPVEAPEAVLERVKLEPPPARGSGRIVGEGSDAVPELLRLLVEEAKVL